MQDIAFSFRGEGYLIPASRAFVVGERVEEIVALTDIAAWAQRPRMFKLARCFGILLREAGARITDDAVFDAIMGKDGEAAAADAAAEAMSALVAVLMGGAPTEAGAGGPPGKASAS